MIEEAWAKSPGDGAYLSVADHGTDVSAVLEALLDAGWADRLARALGRPPSEAERAKMLAAAFLHDMGKVNLGFWRRQFEGAPRVGHLAPLFEAKDDLLSVLGELVEAWGDDLLLAMLAHHGTPAKARQDGRASANWTAAGGYDPIAQLRDLVAMARARHPAAFAPGRLDPRAASLFAGLLSLADWIGSGAERFPLDGVTGAARRERSRAVAGKAVRQLGLAAEEGLRRAAGLAPFGPTFGVPDAYALQAAAGEALTQRLVILESETGSGKTEAAVWRFLRLLAAGEVDALYLALPTRTSAVQMHDRVRKALDRVFGRDVVPATLAVPGYLRAGGVDGERLGRWDALWPDDPDDALRDARWSAEAAKQFLAARVAVGTVDQALLGGLKVRWAHVRAASLSRSLLVVDEVHASDAYMTEVLAQVLDNHLGAGGHAMLLSATLGAAARVRLVEGRHARLPPLAEAERLPYPALHRGLEAVAPEPGGGGKRVEVALEPWIALPDRVATRALAAARAGGRVLVLRNTVAGAVAVQEALEAAGAPELLWSVEGRPALHHGRFAAEDRRLLDGGIEAAFGKDRPAGGLVAAGTQTLEISLDLDADLLLTDLAPMDVLLQRIGRLHRHRARVRPEGFEAARVVVLVPEARDLSPFLDRVAERHGLGPSQDGRGVYANLAALEATWAELEARGTLDLPRDNRALVERATHPEALEAVVERKGWREFWTRQDGGRIADVQQARGNALDLSVPVEELGAFPDDAGTIATRLGARDRLVALPSGTPGAFGHPVTALRLPEWMARGVALDAEPEVAAAEGGFELRLDGKGFLYDRWGLRGE